MSVTIPPTSMPPTSVPCPAWCIYRGGHGFDAGPGRGALFRRHDHPVRWLQWSHLDGSMPTVSVWMSQVEHAAGPAGPLLRRPVEVVLDGSRGPRLTGPQARQLAAAMVDAADLWDAAHHGGADAPAA